MDLTQIPLFKAMAKKLAWLGARQNVLAENVTNANTPGFRPSDVKPIDFGKLLSGQGGGPLQLVATSPGHIATPPNGGTPDAQKVATSGPIQLEDQMMKVSDTATQYAFTTTLYQKQIALIKEALGH
ncbi:MAG TPA: flagellar basal body protein [Stellaceae bacterium]|nr:flagellar basal body protein [Stellaceae bacterium]